MTRAIIPWMGGKRRLAKEILPLINGWRTYVEAFCGGASLFFMKKPSKAEIINDLNGELVNLYRVVQHHPEELNRQFEWLLIARDEFSRLKLQDPSLMTDVQRAARFYFMMKTAFGGRVKNPSFGTARTTPAKLNPGKLIEDLKAAHIRLARVTIENRSWEKCVEQYDSDQTCCYLDPPYWQTTGYTDPFPYENYERMADLMRFCKGRLVISINDHSEIRQLFDGFNMKRVSLNYTVGASNKTKRSELIIWNR